MKKITFIIALTGITSFNLLHAQSTNPAPYCDASFDDAGGFLVDDHINSVSFGTINNNSNAQFNAPHYVFYNNLPVANFARGNSYTLNLNLKTAGACGYGVWIDFNQNNIFETTEKVAGTTNNPLAVGGIATVNQSVSIPSSASLGNTRMRVRIVEDDFFSQGTNFNTLPCNLSANATDVMDWGETEDYLINITSAVGVQPINAVNEIYFYPNPARNAISLDHPVKAGSYNLYNLNGQLVLSGNLNAGVQLINISDLAEGVYQIELFENNQLILQQKLVKIADQ